MLIIITADYYISMKRRREFFNEFAFSHGFDPLVPDHWYTIARERILQLKVTFYSSLYLLFGFLYLIIYLFIFY